MKAQLHFQGCECRCYPRTSIHQLGKRRRRASTVAEAGAIEGHVDIIVRVPAYKLEFGQELRLVGGAAALGSWNPTDAAPLTWAKGDNWSTMTTLPTGRHEVKV